MFLIMFKTGHALLLPGGRFLSPRSGRGLDAECPRHRPACWPWPCPVRDRVQSETSPQPRLDRNQSVSVVVSGPRMSAASPCPRTIRVQSASAPGSPWLRVNRPSILWLAARRQGKTPPLPREFHLDDARFAGRKTGNLEFTREVSQPGGWPHRGHSPVSAVSGHSRFTAKARTAPDKLRP